jgi:hypothetical protein
MIECDWKDEQRDVLTRLFEAAFERCAASEEQIKSLSRGGNDLGSRRIDVPEALPKSGNG